MRARALAAQEVREELLALIIEKYDKSKDGEIERADLLPAVRKYSALLKYDIKLTALFAKHDTDNTKRLSPEQLLALLTELAAEKDAAVPTAECDVAFVLERCDQDSSGTSARARSRRWPPSVTCPDGASCAPRFVVACAAQSRTRSWGPPSPRGGSTRST